MTRRVAIIIPTLNEADQIGALLSQFTRQLDDRIVEIWVADGGSLDSTCAIVTAAAQADPRIRLIDNPARIQSAGINRAAALVNSRVDTLIRVDAHALYPDNYVDAILMEFARTGAEMIAVRLDTQGITSRQRGIAAAANSRIGSGGSAHRVGGYSGFVDHGHHAGMDRSMFERVGGYDERFAANEDAEFDVRVRAARGRIWLAGDIEIVYFPRKTFEALFRQYLRYGRGRAQTWLKHRERLRLRQLLPPLVISVSILALLLSPSLPVLLAIPGIYLGAVTLGSLALFARIPKISTLLAAPAMIVMHTAWSLGFVAKLLGAQRWQRRPPLIVTQADPIEMERARL